MPKISTEQIKKINSKCSNRLAPRLRILHTSRRKATNKMYRINRRKLHKIHNLL